MQSLTRFNRTEAADLNPFINEVHPADTLYHVRAGLQFLVQDAHADDLTMDQRLGQYLIITCMCKALEYEGHNIENMISRDIVQGVEHD